jgi:hypothetical protein
MLMSLRPTWFSLDDDASLHQTQRCKSIALSASLACFHYITAQNTDELTFYSLELNQILTTGSDGRRQDVSKARARARIMQTTASMMLSPISKLASMEKRSLNVSIVHKSPLTSFTLGRDSGVLYTASLDTICSWSVDERFLFNSARPILPLQIFHNNMGAATILEAAKSVIVCAVGNNAVLLDAYPSSINLNCNLGSHLSNVSALYILNDKEIISGSDDRTFKGIYVYTLDIENETIVFISLEYRNKTVHLLFCCHFNTSYHLFLSFRRVWQITDRNS